MDRTGTHKHLPLVLFATVVLFVAGRIAGENLMQNNWSFTHWDHFPYAYLVGWWIGAALLAFALGRFLPAIAAFLESRRNTFGAGFLLLALFWVFQFDSFLYGGGNVELARVAQEADVILPWYAYGSTLIVWLLNVFWSLFDLHYNLAGVLAWKTMTFAAGAFAVVGAWKIAGLLTEDPTRRLGLFLILFFGPQFLLYLGFVGVAPVIAAVAVWTAWGITRLVHQPGAKNVAVLWGIVVLGVVLHASCLFLVPGAVVATIGSLGFVRDRESVLPVVAGGLALAAIAVALYIVADGYLLLRSYLLPIDGKPPHADYGLFSWRHMSDMLQTIFLLFPLGLAALLVLLRRVRWVLAHALPSSALLLFLGGVGALTVMDPVHSIVLDLPRLAAYLAPGAFLLAILVGDRKTENNISPAVIGLLAALSLVLPLSYLPAYTRIATAERYTTPYLDRHNAYYRTAGLAFRDAYFYRKELDEANRWDQDYDRKSPDYLNLSGITEFATGDRLDIALPSLNKLIARNPYWAEPRALYAKYMMEQGKYASAKPALDTALFLEPYNPAHHSNLYAWYRDQNRFDTALMIIEHAAQLFPNNKEIYTDLMIINYRTGRHDVAAALAEEIIEKYPTQAYPWVIKGFLAEKAGNLADAQKYFERFAGMAPDAPEAPQIRKRANDIYLKLSGRAQ